ncbi:MAG: tetratricopeptide repeat protein [Elusimicrobia bacterium]|nr:tetratricopeptide repeat protein [Candidatus Obscuribacterium magneticum]
MRKESFASKLAFFTVLAVFGGSFIWWFVSRPSFLLYQAHSRIGKENQPAVIEQYRRLLKKTDLTPEKEIELRLGLGEFYLEASGEMGTVVLRSSDDRYGVDHPFLTYAKDEFDRVLKLNPKDARAHYDRGRLFLYQGLETFALEEINLSHKCDPKLPQPLTLLARIQLERGDPEIARDLALEALALSPDEDDARWVLVRSYSLLDDQENAQKEYHRLSFQFKTSPEVRSHFALFLAETNMWEEGEAEMNLVYRNDSENMWVLLNNGRFLLKKGFLEEASGQFMRAADLYRRNPWPYVWLVQVDVERGFLDRARHTVQILKEGLPRWPWTSLAEAQVLDGHGKVKEALDLLSEATEIQPKFFEAVLMKGEILLFKGDYDRLGPLIRPLLDKKIYESVGYTLLSQSFYEQKKWSLAEETAEIVIQNNVRDERPYVWLGLSRAHLGEWDAAERAFQFATKLNPFNMEAVGYFGYLKALEKKWVEADNNINWALQTSPRSAVLWCLKGQIHSLKNEGPEAIQCFQQAVSLKPYYLKAQLGLVESFWKKGDRQAAKASLEAALKINSHDKEVLSWRAKIRGFL